MHFRNVHALVKNNRPLSDIKWLYELDKAKGLEIGDTYDNRKAAAMFWNIFLKLNQTRYLYW